MGERDAAVKLVDALLTVQNADGSFPFSSQQGQLYEHNADFIRIGAVAWVCYALLLCASTGLRRAGSPIGPAARRKAVSTTS